MMIKRNRAHVCCVLFLALTILLTACSEVSLPDNSVSPQELRARGLLYYENGQLDNALRDLEKLDKEALGDFEIWAALGNIWRQKKDLEKAKSYYTRAIDSHALIKQPSVNLSTPEARTIHPILDDIFILAAAYREAYFKLENLDELAAKALRERGLFELFTVLIDYRLVDPNGLHPSFYSALKQHYSKAAEELARDTRTRQWPDASSVVLDAYSLRVGDWYVTAGNSGELRYTSKLGSGFLTEVAEEGHVFVLVYVTIQNATNKTQSFDPFVSWTLYDSNDYQYSIQTMADLYLDDSERLSTTNVPPNASRSGFLVFQINASNYEDKKQGQFVLQLNSFLGESLGAWYFDEFSFK